MRLRSRHFFALRANRSRGNRLRRSIGPLWLGMGLCPAGPGMEPAVPASGCPMPARRILAHASSQSVASERRTNPKVNHFFRVACFPCRKLAGEIHSPGPFSPNRSLASGGLSAMSCRRILACHRRGQTWEPRARMLFHLPVLPIGTSGSGWFVIGS